MVDVAEVLAELGGVASRAELLRTTERRHLDAALRSGVITASARGRYVLPAMAGATTLAHALCGVLSYRHACLQHGWSVKQLPTRPELTMAKGRRPDPVLATAATLHRADLGSDDVVRLGGVRVTSTDRTLVDCLRGLPFDEAITIADAALRSGVTPGRLRTLVRDLGGPGSRQARRVAREATPLAASPLESVLRAVALDVPGLAVRPQVPLWAGARFLGRPDLVDEDLGVVLEADSFAWHGDRTALAHDARRYNEMVAAGWTVLRFSYEAVMGEQAWVREMLEAVVDRSTDHRHRAA